MTPAMAAGGDVRWAERAATTTIFLALGTTVGTWAAAIPMLQSELGLDAARLSFVLLTIPIACVIGTIGMGVIAPRFGSGPMTAAAALASVVSFALPGLAHTYPQLLACGVAMGLATGGLEVAANGHASDIERRWGSAIMSSFHAAFSIGGLLGALMGGLAAWAGAGQRGQLWLPLSLAAVGVLVALPALGPGARRPPGPRPRLGRPQRAVLILGGLATLSYLLEGAVTDWSAVYMARVIEAPDWLAPAGFAAFSVTMTVGRLTGDIVVDRLGPSRVLLGGGLIAAAGLVVAVTATTPWPVALGFGLVGIGAANGVPIVFSAAGRTATSPAAGIALVSTCGFAGFLGGPPLIGALATWLGLRVGIGSLIVVAVLVAVAAPLVGGGPGQPSRRRSRT